MMGNGEVDTGTALSLANAPATVTIVIGTVPALIPPLALSNIAAAHAPAPLLVAEGILTPLVDTRRKRQRSRSASTSSSCNSDEDTKRRKHHRKHKHRHRRSSRSLERREKKRLGRRREYVIS